MTSIQSNTEYDCNTTTIFLDFSLTVKAAPHECEIRTSQP